MRVLFSTTANDGHFGPLQPFARACAAAGHEVRVAAPASYAGVLTRSGFRLEPSADAPPELIGPIMARLPTLSFDEADEVVLRDVFGRVDAQPGLPAPAGDVRPLAARLACAAGTPSSPDVLLFDEHPLAVLLAGAPDQAAALAQAVLGRVLELPGEDCAVLLETARTWLETEGATSTAAQQLHLHRNTVRYRLRRLEELTGRDLMKPIDAAELHVALECVRILGRDVGPAT